MTRFRVTWKRYKKSGVAILKATDKSHAEKLVRENIQDCRILFVEEVYRPSNSDEGMAFEAEWCENCIRHPRKPEAKHQCKWLGLALIGDNTKWVIRNEEPVCIEFKSRKEVYRNRKPRHDPRQMELFA